MLKSDSIIRKRKFLLFFWFEQESNDTYENTECLNA